MRAPSKPLPENSRIAASRMRRRVRSLLRIFRVAIPGSLLKYSGDRQSLFDSSKVNTYHSADRRQIHFPPHAGKNNRLRATVPRPERSEGMTEVARALRDQTAVCGAGLLIGDYPEGTPLSLAVAAYQLALDDAGLRREDVDGIITLSFGSDYDRFLEAVGTDVRYAYQGWSHGRFIAPMLQHAAMVVASGMAKTVAIVHGRRRKAYGQTADPAMGR